MDLAAHWAGIAIVAHCEADAWNRSILLRHWPEVPVFESDEQVTRESLRAIGIDRINIVAGGPPCQPFSVAGKRGGEQDPRHRWPQMARIVDELRPAFVVVENVAGFSDVAEQLVRADLDGLGYRSVRFDIPAAGVGAPHRRERIFVVGYADDERSARGTRAGREAIVGAEHAGGMAYTDACAGRAGAEHADDEARERQPERRRSVTVGNTTSDDERRTRLRDEPGSIPARGSSGDGSGTVGHSNERGRGVERLAAQQANGERRGAEPVRAEQPPAECGSERTVGHATIAGRERATLRQVGDEESSARDRAGALESGLGRGAGRATDRLDEIGRAITAQRWPAARGAAQYEWEPPRVTTDRHERRKRLKALGNICVPEQVALIFAAIVTVHEERAA